MNDNIISHIQDLENAITAEMDLKLECVRLVLDAKEAGNWNSRGVLDDARAFYNWISYVDPDPSGEAHETAEGQLQTDILVTHEDGSQTLHPASAVSTAPDQPQEAA